MEIPDKQLVRTRFERGLKSYSESAAVQRQMAEKLMSLLSNRNPSPFYSRILEIGAGTGLLTEIADRRLDWKERVVLDLVSGCAEYHAGRRNTVFLAGDAEQINWGSQPFDLILSNAAFQWFADLDAFAGKLRRSLSTGGWLAFTSFGPDNLHELTCLTGRSLKYFPARQLQDLLEKQGFAVRECIEEIQTQTFDEPLDILRHFRRTGVSASAGTVQRWTRRHLAEFCAEYRRRFSAGSKVSLTWNPIYMVAKGI